jgi:preprotein translocase subunit SecA
MSMPREFDTSALYHQYRWSDEKPLDRAWRVQMRRLRSMFSGRNTLEGRVARRLQELEAVLLGASDDELVEKVWGDRRKLRRSLTQIIPDDEALLLSLASIRESARRITGMRLHDVQIHGAICMLMGSIAEMQTGEGKSLTAVPVAIVAAVAGFPIHIVTVNEYLASRDAREFAPIFAHFGLDVGLVLNDMQPNEKALEYRKPVTYCTNKDLAFDHMRDRLSTENFNRKGHQLLSRLRAPGSVDTPTILPGLRFALVDEADSVLLDEAGTPLIIAREGDPALEEALYRSAVSFARGLTKGVHFTIETLSSIILWTPDGELAVSAICEQHGGLWSGPRRAREWLEKALRALYLYQRGRDYIVDDQAIQIVDPNTGRRMPDRQWEGGMHQLIEVKEGLPVTPRRETLAKTTYQRFFRRYWRVAGMSGTISEVRDEIFSTYGVGVQTIATNQPCRRISWSTLLYSRRADAIDAVCDSAAELQSAGRPVLIGTQSVADSEDLSASLAARGLSHRVLNAINDRHEAEIVAGAGAVGAITVATNMAGRGTDIRLDEAARSAGGLHVLAFGMGHSKRVDRQLCGRCARQGDPGSYQMIVSLEDDLLVQNASLLVAPFIRMLRGRLNTCVVGRPAQLLLRSAQRRIEHRHRVNRAALLASEDRLANSMGFVGAAE